MNEIIRDIHLHNCDITIKLVRYVAQNTYNLDGHIIDAPSSNYERITIQTEGRTFGPPVLLNPQSPSAAKWIEKGAVAHCSGGFYLTRPVYDAVTVALAEMSDELGKSEEYLANEAAENHRRQLAEENETRLENEIRERNNHPGWCNKCGSYCYGDCTANQS